MTVESSSWDLGQIGRWSDPSEFEVTRERIAAYAAATNDEHPAHAAGDLAPPVFAIVPAFGVVLPALTAPVPEELVPRGVHGQQDFRFHQPITPGLTLTSRAGPLGITQRSTGTVVLVRGETRDERGALVVEQLSTYFVRGGQADENIGEPLPEHAFPAGLRESDPVASVVQAFEEDTTHRYAEASGDPMRIHLDDAYARETGLPGIIIHGLCTMAYTSRAVVQSFCAEDPTRLRRLAVRFSSLVLPSDELTTKLWTDDEAAGEDVRVAFESSTSSGNVAMKDGLADIAPHSS